ncbi:molybdenum-pterin-binding protein [Komagataeibacter rhaeticus DSM 16663]|mgnify:CR=1 FL=1|nr:molybdenum-pterin-binding protein [Komagataeibacter rhaeticus DSM 16663]SAY49377.1 Molybdenum-pterin-binding protein 2 [Komagataeibacter rhaeticus]
MRPARGTGLPVPGAQGYNTLHDDSSEDAMKVSARNQLSGRITKIVKGATTSHVSIDIGGKVITASITNEAVDDLGLRVGEAATAIIKASDVMVGV